MGIGNTAFDSAVLHLPGLYDHCIVVEVKIQFPSGKNAAQNFLHRFIVSFDTDFVQSLQIFDVVNEIQGSLFLQCTEKLDNGTGFQIQRNPLRLRHDPAGKTQTSGHKSQDKDFHHFSRPYKLPLRRIAIDVKLFHKFVY